MVFAKAQNNKPVKFWAKSSTLEQNKENTPLLHNLLCFQMLHKRLKAWSLLLFEWELITPFSKNTFTSWGSVSHNVLCYQVSIACYKVRFYAKHFLFSMTSDLYRVMFYKVIVRSQDRSLLHINVSKTTGIGFQE